MWVAGLVAAALQHQAAGPPDSHWRWIANDADVAVAADGHSIAATGDRRTFNLATIHRTALADGADILQWRVETDCRGVVSGRLVARNRTVAPPTEGTPAPSEWGMVSHVVATASAALCNGRLDPYRRGRPVGGDRGFTTVQGVAQMARTAFRTSGTSGEWRVLGELEAAPFMVAMEARRPWDANGYKARRLALVGPDPVGGAFVTLTTALIDCDRKSVTLVDTHGLTESGLRIDRVNTASSYFSLDTASFRRNDIEAELGQSVHAMVCENQVPDDDGDSFSDVTAFARLARAYLNQ